VLCSTAAFVNLLSKNNENDNNDLHDSSYSTIITGRLLKEYFFFQNTIVHGT